MYIAYSVLESFFLISRINDFITKPSVVYTNKRSQAKVCIYNVFRRVAGAGAGRSRGFWPEPEPKFSPGSGSGSG